MLRVATHAKYIVISYVTQFVSILLYFQLFKEMVTVSEEVVTISVTDYLLLLFIILSYYYFFYFFLFTAFLVIACK